MFDWVLDVVKQMFQMFFDFMNSVELREGVTFWSLLLVFLIGGGIASAVIRHIGGASLASLGPAIYDNYVGSKSAADALSAKQREEAASVDDFMREVNLNAERNNPNYKWSIN